MGELLGLLNVDLATEVGGLEKGLASIALRMEGTRVEYANAASPDLLYKKADAAHAMAVLPHGRDTFRGPPIGIVGPDERWTALRFSPGPGDFLLAYTEGLIGARSPTGEEFGRDGLLTAFAAACARDLVSGSEPSAADVLGALIAAVASFRGESRLDDDLTAILLKRMA